MSQTGQQSSLINSPAPTSKAKKPLAPGQSLSKIKQKRQRQMDATNNFPGLEAALPAHIINAYVTGKPGMLTTRLMNGAVAHIQNLHQQNSIVSNADPVASAETPAGKSISNLDPARHAEYSAASDLKSCVPEQFQKLVPVDDGGVVGRLMRAATLYIDSFEVVDN